MVFAYRGTVGTLGREMCVQCTARAFGGAARVRALGRQQRDRLLRKDVSDRVERIERHTARRADGFVLDADTEVALGAYDVSELALHNRVLGDG